MGISESTIYIGAFIVIFIILQCLVFSSNKHKRNIRKAKKALNVVRGITEPQRQFGYLRKVDPFVFEEMILTSLSDLDFKIERNKRYTGDGGIDGKVIIAGDVVLIQAKRYKAHINSRHVEEFSKICKKKLCQGIFIHTGKTGRKSRAVDHGLDIVSGARMIELLCGNSYKPRFKNYESTAALNNDAPILLDVKETDRKVINAYVNYVNWCQDNKLQNNSLNHKLFTTACEYARK